MTEGANMAYDKQHTIYETKFTLETLLDMANYQREAEDDLIVNFPKENIDQLGEDIQEAVQAEIERFLMSVGA